MGTVLRVLSWELLSKLLNSIGIQENNPSRESVNRWITNRRAETDARRFEPGESFSQGAEDMVTRSLIDTDAGRYVDIGSGHPVRGSNTYSLYRQGWSGLLVDPLRTNIELSRKIRRRDTCVEALCAYSDQPAVTFWEYTTYEYSTASPNQVAELARRGHTAYASYDLRSYSLETLVRAHGMLDARLLSIDVEGMDLEVLQGNNWKTFHPEIIIVEEWESPPSQSTPIRQFLCDHDYDFVAFTRASSVFLSHTWGSIRAPG
jgi:FkbM family methyltransferase